MKQKTSFIIGLSLMAIAVVIFLFVQKKNDHSPVEAPDLTSKTRALQRQDDSQTAQSQRERKAIEETVQLERKKMITFWTNNASAGFAISKKNLIADLNLNAAETAEVDKIFARREAQLAELLTVESTDDIETLRQICGLLRNKGLREDLAGILSPAKLSTFDANEATRERDTIEARAYRDMADINSVVTLTDTQKQQALAALIKNAPVKIEQEADARAFMTLQYGQTLTDVDSSSIRGLSNMVSASLKNEMPDTAVESSHYELWTQINKTDRINQELSTLQNVLDEKQLTRYREHLEKEPAW